jgi:[acyl-carrier-protein] S-malonyltransferase
MLTDLAANYPTVKQTFEEASEVLNYDLWKLCQEGPEEALNQTERTQPALLAASIAVWRVWCTQGGRMPVLMAGHSFGEYSALVCAEAFSYIEGIRLAQARGQFMQSSVARGIGAVAAVLGLEDSQVIQACAEAAGDEVVSAVNFNAPNQVVIAGHKTAVERALNLLKTMGAKRATLLPISVPVHCSLMQPAAERMFERLATALINPPNVPILHNVDISAKTEAEAIRIALSKQITHPVQWTATINKMFKEGITTVIECGPGKVLTGLNKRIVKSLNTLSISDAQSIDQAMAVLEKE